MVKVAPGQLHHVTLAEIGHREAVAESVDHEPPSAIPHLPTAWAPGRCADPLGMTAAVSLATRYPLPVSLTVPASRRLVPPPPFPRRSRPPPSPPASLTPTPSPPARH